MPCKGVVFGAKNCLNCVKNAFLQKLSVNHCGCTNKCFEPIFGHILIQFSPFGHMYAPSCTLCTHPRAYG